LAQKNLELTGWSWRIFFFLGAKSKKIHKKVAIVFFLLQYLVTFLSQFFLTKKYPPPQKKISDQKVAKFYSKQIQKIKTFAPF
jgi:hypothetical protein